MPNRKVFKLSLIAAACMAVSVPVFAGQIIGIQQGAPSPEFLGANDYKNGFKGWNLGNVDVRIIDVETGLETKSFNPEFGSYTQMVLGETFKSDIYDRSVVGSTVGAVRVAILGGKDWPKGEPSGIKVITTDDIEDQTNGRPNSCIMSTSYHPFHDEILWESTFELPAGATSEDGVLGSDYINPTLCDSPFQTHKRFKVSALPGSIIDTDETTYGVQNNGVDIVFNLDTVNTASTDETALRRYTVLQKLNNYTDSRLTGFRIELGFGVGEGFQKIDSAATDTTLIDNLHLSLGTGETIIVVDGKEKTTTDFWRPEDWAKFSAGLFSLADAPHHPNNGFFSAAPDGVGYDVALKDEDGNIIDSATSDRPFSSTIESTSVLSPEYKNIFGDWLPSKMAPKGVFYDDDMDPATDNELVAFWGDDPATTEVDFKWLSGNENDFAPITNDQLYTWANNTGMPVDGTSQYAVGIVEDVLNLGLNYMVEVGDVSKIPSDTFTIRMIPVTKTDVDNTDPGWITDPAADDIAAAIPASYVPPVETSSGGSAAVMDNAGMFATLLAFLGLGGWIVRRKLAK